MARYQDVTLLVTHYNRSKSLERLLKAFNDLDIRFGGIVVSDDGSKKEHLEHLESLKDTLGFTLVTTSVNKGLGNNINKGQDAVITPYTLYVQEDFVPKAKFAEKLPFAIAYLDKHPDTDLARFYAYFRYPYLEPVGEGFSKMIFKLWYPGYRKFYYYSDHPHLRRSTFFDKFGRYKEGLKVEVTEYKMMMSVLGHHGKAIYYDDFQGLFDQLNSSAEPSTVKRNIWRESGNPLISFPRHLYRHLRFNFDFLFNSRK
jgi:glycosyltransferase involved in cell wall biosynthesis